MSVRRLALALVLSSQLALLGFLSLGRNVATTRAAAPVTQAGPCGAVVTGVATATKPAITPTSPIIEVTDTPTPKAQKAPTDTPTPVSGETPTPLPAAPTDTPTDTPVPTDTPTDTPTPLVLVVHDTPTDTPVPASTPTPTDTPVPTDTPTLTPLFTPTPVIEFNTPTPVPATPVPTPRITSVAGATQHTVHPASAAGVKFVWPRRPRGAVATQEGDASKAPAASPSIACVWTTTSLHGKPIVTIPKHQSPYLLAAWRTYKRNGLTKSHLTLHWYLYRGYQKALNLWPVRRHLAGAAQFRVPGTLQPGTFRLRYAPLARNLKSGWYSVVAFGNLQGPGCPKNGCIGQSRQTRFYQR